MPKISVILTSFNHAEYIGEAIESVLVQTFIDFELIIWDDASQDDSWATISSYDDPRIRAFRNDETRRGIYGLNKAISEVARGEYIAIHHSDDAWEPEKLAKQVAFLDAHQEYGAVFTNALIIDDASHPFTNQEHPYFSIFDQGNRSRHEWLNRFFYQGNALCHPSAVVRRQCYEDCGLYRYGLAQLGDFDMWVRLCMKYEIYVLPEKLTRFRVRNNEENTSGNRRDARLRVVTESCTVTQNFLGLGTFEDIAAVFPEAQNYYRKDGFLREFVLAMICLRDDAPQWTKFFALDLLFELIRDQEKSSLLKLLYGFDYRDLIKITGEIDTLSREELAYLNQVISERSCLIASLNQAAAEREGQLASLNHIVAERDNQIAGLNQVMAEREGQLASLNHIVAERDNQIAGLNQVMAEREGQLAGLNQIVAERDNQITGLHQAAAEREERIADLHKAIEALRRSTSWRVTAPLRWPRTQLMHTQRLAKLPLRALQLGGGLKPTLRKALNLYRREGVSGLRRGARFVSSGASSQQIVLSVGGESTAVVAVDRNDYSEWVRRYDTLDEAARTAIRKRISAMENPPLISVVMPTYNPNPKWLAEAIESVRGQLYPHWELCIADDASPDPVIRPLLEKFAREDARIKLVLREQNGHISAASNSALQLASGDWVALLDHDDLLAEHALYCVADSIVANPSIQMIYSDEDKINEAGHRHGPYFKCDWNPDLFYSHNMICHLGVYHRPLLERIGGFRLGFEGSQDYDLALRCIEEIEPTAIHHIPRVLYHWRVHAESTAGGADAKPYALLAGERAINEHFQRRGIAGKVELISHGYRARYDLPEELPLVSLIIPTRNGLQLIRQCIDSIVEKTTYPHYEIIVVDNGSDDPAALKYFTALGERDNVRVLRDERPFNYSALNNAAVAVAKGEIVGLINNDIEVISPDWLSEMVGLAVQSDIGAVGAKLLYPDDTLQHGGVVLGIGGVAGHSHKNIGLQDYGYFSRAKIISAFSAVTAACLLVKKSIYQEVNGLNEDDLTVAFNDVDFCLRVREAGYRNVWTPYAELYHHESATRGFEDNPVKQARFAAEVAYMKMRWSDQLLNDPAYSPNLTLDHEDFSLAWPPRVGVLA